MSRNERYDNRKPSHPKEIALKLIGAGLLLLALPMLLSGSPVAAAFRAMVPFGWLLVLSGCGLLWWRMRAARSRAREGSTGESRLPPPNAPPLA